MSKFFSRTQKAQGWVPREDQAIKLEVEQVLEAVKVADAVADQLSESHLSHCRRIDLPIDSRKPTLLAMNGNAPAAVESYRALRTRLLRLQENRGIHSVVLSSALPGEGKTITTLNLGLCCAQLNDCRVLVVDGDLRTRGLSALLGRPPEPGLSDVLAGQVPPESAILATNQPNLYFLGAGTSSLSAPQLYATPRWKEFIGWCSESFRIVLVDSPPILPLVDFEQMAGDCDGVLLVVRALQTQRDALRKAILRIDPKKLLGGIYNSYASDKKSHYAYYTSNEKHE